MVFTLECNEERKSWHMAPAFGFIFSWWRRFREAFKSSTYTRFDVDASKPTIRRPRMGVHARMATRTRVHSLTTQPLLGGGSW